MQKNGGIFFLKDVKGQRGRLGEGETWRLGEGERGRLEDLERGRLGEGEKGTTSRGILKHFGGTFFLPHYESASEGLAP
ncbi:MAG: hypothetical protein R6U64_07640 [Bacteroidales bacterium]